MSLITVQIGQCGNQIGTELFELLSKDAQEAPQYADPFSRQNQEYRQQVLDRFFTTRNGDSRNNNLYFAKSILVDTEPKVINRCLQQASLTGKWCFNDSNICCKKQGSGNNWAHGYQRFGMEVSETFIDIARKEAEQCDWFSGFLVMMSLAGGTGSGLGTYLTHCIHDNFEDAFVVNQVVWPYSTGEVILQNYNAILSLSHLYQSSNGVIILKNDSLDEICKRLLNLKQVSFHDLNKVISHKLASLLQPAFSHSNQSNNLGNIVSTLCCHPAYKLLSLNNIPQLSLKSMDFTTFIWSPLMKHLRQMLITDAALEEGMNWEVKVPTSSVYKTISTSKRERGCFNKSLANSIVVRGKDLQDVSLSDFSDKKIYSGHLSENGMLTVWNQERPFNNYEKSATLVSNSQSFVKPLNHVIQRAWNMFAGRAYVHQYNKYGLTDNDFIDSFGYVEQILADYESL